MLELTQENPFNELPEALVVDMLNKCDGIGRKLTKSFQYLFESKKDIRKIEKKSRQAERKWSYAVIKKNITVSIALCSVRVILVSYILS